MGFEIEVIDRKTAERIAHVIGEHSAHAQALRELDARIARGEDAVIGRRKDGAIIVVSTKYTKPMQ